MTIPTGTYPIGGPIISTEGGGIAATEAQYDAGVARLRDGVWQPAVRRGSAGAHTYHWPHDARPGLVDMTLDAGAISGLEAARIALIPTPPAGHYIVPGRLFVLKTGGPADPPLVADTSLWLAVAGAAGGLIESTTGSPDYMLTNALHTAGRFGLPASGWVRGGDYAEASAFTAGSGFGLGFFSGGGAARSMWTGGGLTILGYAEPVTEDPAQTAAERWTEATTGLGDIAIRLVLDYVVADLS